MLPDRFSPLNELPPSRPQFQFNSAIFFLLTYLIAAPFALASLIHVAWPYFYATFLVATIGSLIVACSNRRSLQTTIKRSSSFFVGSALFLPWASHLIVGWRIPESSDLGLACGMFPAALGLWLLYASTRWVDG